jgi:vitamin B12 transporter
MEMVMKKTFRFCIVLAFAGAPLLLISGEQQKQKTSPPPEHHEVVVTATRLETPAREVASSVTVISAEDLSRLRRNFVLEALQEVAGLSLLQNGGQGGAASVFLRGANSEHTLVLLDGVALNDPINPSRSADLAHLETVNVERLEVLRGPQSPLYGSDAIGGVINIITRKGEGKPRWTLTGAGGSYGTMTGQAAVSGSSRGLDYSFGISRYETRGISSAGSAYTGNTEKDGYTNLTLSGRIGFRLRDNLEISLIGRAVRAKTDIDNFGGPSGDDPNNSQDYRSEFFRTEFRSLLLKNRWEQKLGFAVVHSRRDHRNLQDEFHPLESETGFFESRLFKMDWQNNFFVHPANTLTLGLEFESETGESEYLSEGPWGPYGSIFPRQKAKTVGFYVQDYLRLADRAFAALGVRFDHHSQAGDAVTYRLAPAYIVPASRTKFRASWGTGFKSPSLYQLFAPGTHFGPIGNPDLKPERVAGWEAGVEQPLLGDRLRLSAAYFDNTFRNLIDFDVSRGYINIGRAETKGVEVEFEARPQDGVSFIASYTRLRARDLTDGTDLPRRPKHKWFALVSYTFLTKWTASFSFEHTGERMDFDYSAWLARPVTLPAYALLNAVISYQLRPGLEAFCRLDNILNEKYEMIYGYGTPGLSLQGGVKLSF